MDIYWDNLGFSMEGGLLMYTRLSNGFCHMMPSLYLSKCVAI